MSTTNYLGCEGNLLNPTEANAFRIKINQPLLSKDEFYKIKNANKYGIKTDVVSFTYDYKNEHIVNNKKTASFLLHIVIFFYNFL